MVEGLIKPNHLVTGIKNALRPSAKPKVLQDAQTKLKKELKQVIEHVEDVDTNDGAEDDVKNDQDTA